MTLVYLDTSVALAHLLAEDVRPPERLWDETLVASRLVEYEAWRRLHALGHAESHGEALGELVAGLALLEPAEPIVRRAREEFPMKVRTLDALHLASLLFLVDQGQKVALATYDRRLRGAALALGIPEYELS